MGIVEIIQKVKQLHLSGEDKYAAYISNEYGDIAKVYCLNSLLNSRATALFALQKMIKKLKLNLFSSSGCMCGFIYFFLNY